jgi:ribosomal protein L29
MLAKDLREKTAEQLNDLLRVARRDIARIKTVQKQKAGV